MRQSTKKDIYYVYDANSSYKVFAKYNKKYDCFYHFKYADDYEIEDLDNLEAGQKVIYCWGSWEIYDSKVNKKLTKKMQRAQKERQELEKKYPDLWPEKQDIIQPTTSIIQKVFKEKTERGENINVYIVGIVEILADAMDIRQRERHGKSLYHQLGLKYPEDVEKTINALYYLVEEKLDNLSENEKISLYLYEPNALKRKEYSDFSNELEERTGFYFTSKLANIIRSLEYHCNSSDEKLKRRLRQKPAIYISREVTLYDTDTEDESSKKEMITPEGCKEHYSDILKQKEKVFVNKKNTDN